MEENPNIYLKQAEIVEIIEKMAKFALLKPLWAKFFHARLLLFQQAFILKAELLLVNLLKMLGQMDLRAQTT